MKFAKEKFGRLREYIKKTFCGQGKNDVIFPYLFILGAAVVVLVLIGGLVHQSLAYKSFEVISSIEKNDNVSVNYQVMGNGLLRYSKDGVSYSENLEETVWNQSFEMASARTATCQDYLAIGDIGSNQIRIFLIRMARWGSVTTSYPIVDIAVAAQGLWRQSCLREAPIIFTFIIVKGRSL